MRNKKLIFGAVVLCCVSLVLGGCATSGGAAGTGAGIGAIAGAIIGHQSGHAAEGAAIGAALGAGIGYGVHKVRDRRMKTAEETKQQYEDWNEEQGLKLDVRDGRVAPGTVTPGSEVTAVMEYATLGTGADGASVQETHVLKKDGKVLAELQTDKADRTDGTWEKELTFQVPKNASDGQYLLTQQVSAEGKTSAVSTPFTIDSATAKVSDGPTEWKLALR